MLEPKFKNINGKIYYHGNNIIVLTIMGFLTGALMGSMIKYLFF